MQAATHPPALLRRLWADAPVLTAVALGLALTCLPLLAAMALDGRQFQGESVWLKPLKFHLALVIYAGTLAFYARFVPQAVRQGRGWRLMMGAAALAMLAEVIWIGGAAAAGVASHFNRDNAAMAAIYPLMGVVATVLTAASAVTGWAIWRHGRGLDAALRLSLGLGLGLTFGLTLWTAGYMAQSSGHLVGSAVTGARLPLMGWSREAGDLRVAHFFASHALHAVPLVGWLVAGRLPDGAARGVVWLAALAYVALVAAVWAQAVAGDPLF